MSREILGGMYRTKSLTVTCSSDLIGRCKELQDIFDCEDGHPKYYIKIVDVTQSGYFKGCFEAQFEHQEMGPLKIVARESSTEETADTVTLTNKKTSGVPEELNMTERATDSPRTDSIRNDVTSSSVVTTANDSAELEPSSNAEASCTR